jgi:hypothetical protein
MPEDLKHCVNCKHHRASILTGMHRCSAPQALSEPDLVTGWRSTGDCRELRAVDSTPLRGVRCGPEGAWFEPKPEPEIEIEIRPAPQVVVEYTPSGPPGFIERLWRCLTK